MTTFTVHHDPEGHACNMGWVVRDAAGIEIYRGPQWAANENAQKRNDGTYVDPLLRHAEALDDARVAYADIPQTMRDQLAEVYLPDGVETWWNARSRTLAGQAARDLWGTAEGREKVRDVVAYIAGGPRR